MLFSVSCSQGQQPASQDSVQYYVEAKAFIQWYIDSMHIRRPFVLEDSTSRIRLADFHVTSLKGVSELTEPEKDQIRTGDGLQPFPLWTTELAGNVRLITRDSVRKIFSRPDLHGGWGYFYDHYGRALHDFSCPIFFRNYTLCLFYADYSCGSLCGQGYLCLYRKEGDHWIMVHEFGTWVS